MIATHPSQGIWLWKVFFCAAIFRLIFLIWGWTAWHAEPQDGMSQLYFRQGYGLAAGYGYVSPQGAGGAQLKALYNLVTSQGLVATPQSAPPLPAGDVHFEMLHPPGLALLIAGLHRLVRGPAELPVEVAGLFLDSLAAVLFGWLVSEAFTPGIGYAAGLVYAFFPPAAYGATTARAPEGLMAAFIVGATACVWLAMTRGQQRWFQWCGLGGLVLGVGCAFRPDYLLLPVALGFGAWMMSRRFWVSVRNLVVMQIIALAVMVPWALRNHALCGRWIFTSTSVGATLITGLGEYHNPWGFGSSDTDRAQQAAAQGVASPWDPAADAYFRKLFWQSVEENPAGYLMTIVKRIPLAVAPPLDVGFQNPYKDNTIEQIRKQKNLDRYDLLRAQPGHLLLAYGDVLAAAGVCLAALLADAFMFWRERRRWGLCLFLLCPHLYSVGTHLLAHFEPRFLLPSIWSLLIGLAYVFGRPSLSRGPASIK